MGGEKYSNDSDISDDEVLYRRVRNDQWNWAEKRPSSAAFDDSGNGSPMSVALASLVRSAGQRPSDLLQGHPKFGLVSLTAGQARALLLSVTANPPVSGEPAHGWVVGKKTKSTRRRLAKLCLVVIAPPPFE